MRLVTFAPHPTRCPASRNRPGSRRAVCLAAAAVLSAGLVAGLSRPVRRLEVAGDSMEPTLAAGDRVLVVRRPPRIGEIVAVRHPSDAGRVVLKRVVSGGPAGLWLLGDNPGRSTDSRSWGAVDTSRVVGVALYRYHPADRAGRLARGRYHRPACR